MTSNVFSAAESEELHISNVTSSSLKLRWSSPDPKLFVYFEVVVTRLHDHALVLKTNVSGNELSVDNLESSQTYHAVVSAYTAEGQVVSTRKGIMTTSKSINTPTQTCCQLPSHGTRWKWVKRNIFCTLKINTLNMWTDSIWLLPPGNKSSWFWNFLSNSVFEQTF